MNNIVPSTGRNVLTDLDGLTGMNAQDLTSEERECCVHPKRIRLKPAYSHLRIQLTDSRLQCRRRPPCHSRSNSVLYRQGSGRHRRSVGPLTQTGRRGVRKNMYDEYVHRRTRRYIIVCVDGQTL